MKAFNIAALVVCVSGSAQAQGFYGIQNDPGVMQALSSMSMAFGQSCQMGDQQACYAYQYVQDIGNYMFGASDACLQGNQQGCMAYMQAYQQLDADYGMFLQQYAGAQQFSGGGGMGMTHDQRMQEIARMGAQNTANWQARQQANDQAHQRFIESIRE